MGVARGGNGEFQGVRSEGERLVVLCGKCKNREYLCFYWRSDTMFGSRFIDPEHFMDFSGKTKAC